ncbi:hypothetical protein PCANC_17486 [Puccinia coronata f. sp. avenae]|uniref:Uncharacterized protein n=1 Tax=Puccinia coronata f. sp. avenae TaxID=200324 RepID=A0A2N5SS71_9BASI|nr:hypothetical protein PCANC_17486 [Puccinia coronata f. sp. avenae]PLW34996.1 hypothetical protein PCASD_15321 [Puccinia coronata f. sp. avenae]
MDALKIHPAKKKEIRQYSDLVVYRFQTLLKKYDPDYNSDSNSEISESNDSNKSQEDYPSQGQLTTKTDAWNQLRSTLLPLVRDLITDMHLCLGMILGK